MLDALLPLPLQIDRCNSSLSTALGLLLDASTADIPPIQHTVPSRSMPALTQTSACTPDPVGAPQSTTLSVPLSLQATRCPLLVAPGPTLNLSSHGIFPIMCSSANHDPHALELVDTRAAVAAGDGQNTKHSVPLSLHAAQYTLPRALNLPRIASLDVTPTTQKERQGCGPPASRLVETGPVVQRSGYKLYTYAVRLARRSLPGMLVPGCVAYNGGGFACTLDKLQKTKKRY